MLWRRVSAIGASVAALLVVPAALAATPLEQFIARAGEVPGFVPQGHPHSISTARAWVAVEPPRQAKRDAARLSREGFVVGVFQPLTETHDPNHGQGDSTVLELGSPSGARAEQRVEVREGIAAQGNATIKRYAIPGIPRAQGFTATLPGRGASDAFFTEGQCLVIVADSLPVGDVARPVKLGAKAIFRRTGGRCP